MNTRLLNTPERRGTAMFELVSFFKRHGDTHLAEKFFQAFNGTTLVIPGPEFMRQVATEEAIVKSLQADRSPEARIAIIRAHRISHKRLCELWLAVTDRHMDSARGAMGKETVYEEAARLIQEYPNQRDDICDMFELNAPDRARVILAAQGTGQASSRRATSRA